jgi:hypothetical protein
MPPLKDLTGKRFGKLTIIGRSGQKQGGNILWLALCDCGKRTFATASNMKAGIKKSCGCIKQNQPAHNAVDRTGKRYGIWTVLKKVHSKQKTRTAWLCRCDCGTERVMSAQYLKPSLGGIKSCGCLNHLSRRGQDAPGYKRGYYKKQSGYICFRGENRNGEWREIPFHVAVMEKTIGRRLTPGETVHHKNGIRDDNRIENLELWGNKHPSGQRVEDMISFCIDYLTEYAPECLAFIKEKKCASGN